MKLLHRIGNLLFPPKCILCRKVLRDNETDLCHTCRTEIQEHPEPSIKLPYLAKWCALWYYEEKVRGSLLRYKFSNARSYSKPYGRMLAMKLQRELPDFDILTWVPISSLRKWKRGYDQVQLIAQCVAAELGVEALPTLKKIRHNPPQSGFGDASRRRANVLGAYKALNPQKLERKRVLLLDDIITTGATAGECARILLTAGASEVYCAAIAAASHQHKKQ